MTINQLLEFTITKNASDLHLLVGFPPQIRLHGELQPVPGTEVLSKAEVDSLIIPLLAPAQKQIFERDLEFDFSFEFENKGRFRVNIYRQKGTTGVALRLIPLTIMNLDQLGVPKVIAKIADLKQGFILVTGPTGHGKSTLIASLIQKINTERAVHIVTIEDPIEYVYPPGKSLVSQRELYYDTKSWGNALRSVLREDPDVVLVSEMRDLETISSAMTVAETGHLVFATLHTNSAAQSVDRVVDVFPVNQQPQIRLQLASTLEAIISLRLVPTINPGRVMVTEILFATPAVRNMIRESKTYMIDNLIQTSAELGMVSLESSLTALVKSGQVSQEVAMKYALKPDLLGKLLL